MGKGAAAWALLALLAAGCTQPGPAGPTEAVPGATPLDLPASQALAGAFAFQHPGGSVSFGLAAGQQNVTLYGPDDERVAAFRLAAGTTQPVDAPAGELVFVTQAVAKAAPTHGLSIQSAGHDVATVRRLAWVSGFAVIAKDRTLVPSGPVGPLFPGVSRMVNVTLDAPPIAAVLLQVAGDAQGLDVQLDSGVGPLVTAGDNGGLAPPYIPGFEGHGLRDLVGVTHPQNASGLRVTGRVTYESLDGGVVLSWQSYSRAGRTAALRPGPAAASHGFTYGVLPDDPVQFQYRASATQVRLANSGATGPARVQLWDAKDKRLGPFEIPAHGNITVAVPGGGALVAWRMNGTVELGADRAPADFDLHPLSVQQATYPTRRAGSQGAFGFDEQVVIPAGPVLQLADGWTAQQTMVGFCQDEAWVQVLQGNRTLGSNAAQGWSQAATFMGDGPLTVRYTGNGDDGCDQPGVVVSWFVRQ